MQVLIVIVGLVALMLGLSFLMSYPVMLLWNGCLVPAVTFCNEITWLQAFGLVMLFSMLFKSTSVSQNQ